MPRDYTQGQATTSHKLCSHCSQLFLPNRKDQRFCSSRCRKCESQKKRRLSSPVNSTHSLSKRRDNLVFFDKALRLAEILYSLPVPLRLGFMQDLVIQARSGDKTLRQILSNQYLLRADNTQKWLFHRKCPASYFTIAQAADRYCRKFWGYCVKDVVYGIAPEPPTGEVET